MTRIVSDERIRQDCELRLRLAEPGFAVRTVVLPGTVLYDPIVGWADPDGSFVVSDHGPQIDPRHWDPAQGSGGLYRLHPDDRLETLLAPGTFQGMPYNPRRAPESFGAVAGHIFTTSQRHAGKAGAQAGHVIADLPPGASQAEVFVEIPKAGTVNAGVPGILMIGGFGPGGSVYEGQYFCNSLQNCTIYRVTPDRKAEVLITLEPPNVPERIIPYFVFWGGPSWAEHEGKMIVAGPAVEPNHWTVNFYAFDGFEFNPTPILKDANFGLAMGQVAPPEFGPFGGQTFYVEFGSFNQIYDDEGGEHVTFVDNDGHLTEWGRNPLPYDERIMRIDRDGAHHIFADHLQAGWNEIRFSQDRMIITSLRKSYSSGQYHEPDGSIDEIRLAP